MTVDAGGDAQEDSVRSAERTACGVEPRSRKRLPQQISFFRRDHAQTKRESRMTIRRKVIKL
jgi:hypothetical protein